MKFIEAMFEHIVLINMSISLKSEVVKAIVRWKWRLLKESRILEPFVNGGRANRHIESRRVAQGHAIIHTGRYALGLFIYV